MKAAAGIAAGVLLIPILVVVLLLGDSCETSAGMPAAAISVDDLPVDHVGPYGPDQLVNAAYIINAGRAMGLSEQGQTIGVMTAIGESTLRVLDQGDAVGPDSRGLFQQRGNGAWGSNEDRMDPTISSTNFFRALTAVDGWESLEPTIAAHRVQRNADPYHYARFWQDAVDITAALTGVTVGTGEGQQCPAGSGDYDTAYAQPGPWGGYSNGRIDPTKLVEIPWTVNQAYQGTQVLRADAAAGLIAMNEQYRQEFGHDLPLNDAYRDYDAQVQAKIDYGAEAATPGTSNHGWALAIDVGTTSHARIKYRDATYLWLEQHAAAYGFQQPPWALPGGAGPTEAWHWEFWGLK